MSEATLHGQPVKVGDMVWHILWGWGNVIDVNDNALNLQFEEIKNWFPFEIVFWQPIDPAAIEAAKVKPKEPEYEWQWLYLYFDGYFETTGFYKDQEAMLYSCKHVGTTNFTRIEESKREVKS